MKNFVLISLLTGLSSWTSSEIKLSPKETFYYYFSGLTTNNSGKQTFYHSRISGPLSAENPSSFLESKLDQWRRNLPTTYVNTDFHYGGQKEMADELNETIKNYKEQGLIISPR